MRSGSKISGCVFDVAGKETEKGTLDVAIQKDDFWGNPETAREILRRKSRLEEVIDGWRERERVFRDLSQLYEMAVEEEDGEILRDVSRDLERLEAAVRDDEFHLMLGEEEDRLNAIMNINAGAGGTEAQDWAETLFRMYGRWAERKGYRMQVIDLQPGEEAGIKSASITLEGPHAYGYAKAEIGIHRLVRISPFDAGARRHTSFASVFVYPEVNDEIVIEIDENDLRIDTYRSTGAGGQHVNKTDSAVRITHLPSGIVVQCQNERSQHKNKAMAMKYLKSRLYEQKLQEQRAKLSEVEKGKKDIAWGSQIRSYVLHPYKMVKDHRTSLETGNVTRVLDGDIDDFIEAYLLAASKR